MVNKAGPVFYMQGLAGSPNAGMVIKASQAS